RGKDRWFAVPLRRIPLFPRVPRFPSFLRAPRSIRPHPFVVLKKPCPSLAKLFSEAPHAQGEERERDDEQSQEIGPEVRESASFEQVRARNGCEVMYRIDYSQGLQPLRHRFHGIEGAG